jgi:hypothetical protein
LSATIQDITALTGDADYDAHPGDIRNARVTFVIRGTFPNPDTPITNCQNLTPTLPSSANTKTGSVACSWAANIGSADSATYSIGIVVSNYYTRNHSADDTVINISKPIATNFISGGGYIVNLNSAGTFAGKPGQKTNFGFNMKYNKQLTNLQGNANIIIRAMDGEVYQIKSTSAQSLNVNSSSGQATFLSKCNITKITNPMAPVGLGGNYNLQLTIDDNGEPGDSDTLAITVRSSDGTVLLFSSNDAGGAAVPQALLSGYGGGNTVVH